MKLLNIPTLRTILAAVVILLLGMHSALAITLEEAKSDGLVGEQRDGYLGLIETDVSDEVRALVNDINQQRRERYQQIARDNDVPVSTVAQLAYARAVEATRSGHYVQDQDGRWVRKP